MENEKNVIASEPTEEKKNADCKKKKLNGTQKILIAGFSIIIVGGAVLGYALLNKKEAPSMQQQIESGNFVIDESNYDSIKNTMEEKVADGMFECNMSTTWHFPNGRSASTDAYVANSYTNHKPFYIEVKVDDNTIYTSPLLPVGNSLKELAINSDLGSGTYQASCIYHLMDKLDDGTYKEASSASFVVTLSIDGNA